MERSVCKRTVIPSLARVCLAEVPVRFETTLQRPAEARGIGLHSGVPVSIRILPAPPSTGIVFIRTDLDNFPIPASWRYVARVSYATSLDAAGRADFHYRAFAQCVLQHGRGQRV